MQSYQIVKFCDIKLKEHRLLMHTCTWSLTKLSLSYIKGMDSTQTGKSVCGVHHVE